MLQKTWLNWNDKWRTLTFSEYSSHFGIVFNMRLYRKWWLRVCILFLSVHTLTLNAKGATHWRFENGRLNEIVGEQDIILEKDPLFRMLIDARCPTTKPDKHTLSFSDSYLNEKITASST